jgi:hypothetical protein
MAFKLLAACDYLDARGWSRLAEGLFPSERRSAAAFLASSTSPLDAVVAAGAVTGPTLLIDGCDPPHDTVSRAAAALATGTHRYRW